KLIKKARLIAAPPTHHDLPPTSARRKSGITVRRQSQAFFDSIGQYETRHFAAVVSALASLATEFQT
ncbi:MAG: hypothetical protein WAM74_04815, partial [Xanthobacteraceae bacterium]